MSKLPSGCARSAHSTWRGGRRREAGHAAGRGRGRGRGAKRVGTGAGAGGAGPRAPGHLLRRARGRGVLPEVGHDVHRPEVEHLVGGGGGGAGAGGRGRGRRGGGGSLPRARGAAARGREPGRGRAAGGRAAGGHCERRVARARGAAARTRWRLRGSRSRRATRWLRPSLAAVVAARAASAPSQNASACTYVNRGLPPGPEAFEWGACVCGEKVWEGR